ncbi:hypothetical protein RIF29_19399 [Crotalaria pallida]|uniref:Uncharacterized protein n=1 Tax=Crotalaria pallida TaxID=3830 RepID=A0AAN9F1W3_CROPI
MSNKGNDASESPLGAVVVESPMNFSMTQALQDDNPNLQQLEFKQGNRMTKGKRQRQLLSEFYPFAMSPSNRNEVEKNEWCDLLDIKPTPDKLKIGGSPSSRNVRHSGVIHFDCLLNSPAQRKEHPPPPRRSIPNSLYDPLHERLGFPVDPILRVYLASKHNKGDSYNLH